MIDLDAWASIQSQTVLCLGDVMLDEFVYGDVSRLSPEAPALVLSVNRTELAVGGAGNVARNIAALGARCIFVGLVGRDQSADVIASRLSSEPLIEPRLVEDPSRPTTRKARFVSEHYSSHLLRADWESTVSADRVTEQKLIDQALEALPRVAVVVLSDYSKGVLTDRVIREVIDAARSAGKPVLVDPKRRDLSVYRGASLLTPNKKELGEAARRNVSTDMDIVEAASPIISSLEAEGILVTRSEQGMSLIRRNGEATHVPAHAVKVLDVSGAGDTVAAVFAVMLAAGADWDTALRSSNAAAAVAVGKQGTAVVTASELRTQLLPHASLANEKIVREAGVLQNRLDAWRRQRLRVGFTNGCFDLLHPGHIKLLTEARATCDRLVVGLNDDASVGRLKGAGRPVQNEQARAQVLAALEAVDLVTFFPEDTPLQLIEKVRPDVLIKGSDYTRDQVVGRAFVEANGGELVLVNTAPGFSTTKLVERAAPQKA
ncbi:MAG: D-glycero-beta-D-manno-heptose-7-phosphate kinase [Deltaproteobacteria bacterium]|nr:D-glycero-beta-D-manno-heptose-7-phosphate kinase [Deltaproteobacteria bacterium]